ncbi:MAG: pyridoxine 5'-phosphate synthase [Candidatus Amulumruptor caecigallinarius]|nr:pyridoxine 5'-phosphate synthase [Candidatus Amulumruptor caecigallinarius]
MTRLSVNINKVATLRNARGENIPDVEQFARDCERFGAQGITVHPRPDERHITRQDVTLLADIVTTEFNIEGYPSSDFIELVLKANPAQVTLVPDAPGALTSSAGWDVIANRELLRPILTRFRHAGIRTSVFIDPVPAQAVAAAEIGTDRIEIYTKPYADMYADDPQKAIAPFIETAAQARKSGIGVNAGHDLNLRNLKFFHANMPALDEVSIGHAIISDALYLGIENTIKAYLDCLKS